MSSIFSKIISGEIPAYKVAETDSFLAFLDVFPIAKGHTLVIPKKEIDYIFDVPDNLYKELMLFAKEVSIAVKATIPCKKVGMAVIGIEVPHAHIHLIPINSVSDMNFSNSKLQFSKEEMADLAERIKSNYNKVH